MPAVTSRLTTSTGYDSQPEREARWLQTTTCRDCFVAEKKAEEAKVAALNNAAIAHLDLPPLVVYRLAGELGQYDQDQAPRRHDGSR